MGKRKKKKKVKQPREFWLRKPETQVKESDLIYNRDRDKERLRREED